MEFVAVSGEVRTDLGKKGTKTIRAEEKVPCVLYGKDEVYHFSTDVKKLKTLIYTPEFKIAEIELDGKKYKSILKDIQFHPVTDEVLHIDFLKLIDGHPIKYEVPVGFKGTSPGVKLGGKLQQVLRRVKIKTVPEKMVDRLVLDISKLEMGQSVRIRDLQAIDGVEIITPSGSPVATVEIPRAMRSAASAAQKEVKPA